VAAGTAAVGAAVLAGCGSASSAPTTISGRVHDPERHLGRPDSHRQPSRPLLAFPAQNDFLKNVALLLQQNDT
jgi:hypothetical protein